MINRNNKVILVTGCSSGIGMDAAIELDKAGYSVIATIRKPDAPDQLKASGCAITQCDMSDPESIDSLITSIIKEKVPLYAIINNAGYGQMGALEDISRETLEKQFQVNVFGWHQLTAGLVHVLRKRGNGRIIFVSSVLGFVAMELKGAYNASKYATEGLADTWRLELAGTGVRVSIVEPGPIATKFKINAYHKFVENVKYNEGNNVIKYKKMMSRLSGKERAPFTLDCNATTKAIIHAIGNEPKTRYFVTLPTKIFYYLKKIMPTILLDKLLIMATKKG